jgi:hypothetical protein
MVHEFGKRDPSLRMKHGIQSDLSIEFLTPLKKGHPREKDWYMWGCGHGPHPHIYPFLLLEGGFSVYSFMISSRLVETLRWYEIKRFIIGIPRRRIYPV